MPLVSGILLIAGEWGYFSVPDSGGQFGPMVSCFRHLISDATTSTSNSEGWIVHLTFLIISNSEFERMPQEENIIAWLFLG